MYLEREVEISQPGEKKNGNSQRELKMPHEEILMFKTFFKSKFMN